MPEYLAPGVYIEEVDTGPRPIEGVGTSTAAFVGFAPAGPANRPQLITNWSQYTRVFGLVLRAPQLGESEEDLPRDPHMADAYLSHAVYGFFQNGGGRCWVTRVETAQAGGQQAPASRALPSRAGESQPALIVTAKDTATGNVSIEVSPPTADPAPEGGFNLRLNAGDVNELHENLTPGKRGWLDGVNASSKIATLSDPAKPATAVADRTPAFGAYNLVAAALAPQSVQSSDLVGTVDDRSGVEGLEIAEDVSAICCPDLMSPIVHGKNDDGSPKVDQKFVQNVQQAMVTHCYRLSGRMAILDPPPNLAPKDLLKWRTSVGSFAPEAAKFAALYYPWVTVRVKNVQTGKEEEQNIPPCGHIAGIFARTDRERGVHKAPANMGVLGVQGVATHLTKGEQEVLNPNGINCIRVFPSQGPIVWGARTLTTDPAWRYVNVRRLFNYVEKSIERSTQWVVFEPNDPNLWARVRRDISAFLTVCWRDGMLFGLTPAEAFFVKCDAELNSPAMRDLGRLIIEVGLAPVKPAEFVVFRFSQYVSGGA